MRFEAEERVTLQPLAEQPYPPLVLPAARTTKRTVLRPLTQLDGGTLRAPAALEAPFGYKSSRQNNRRLQAAMRSSRLPVVKILPDFDFSFQPSLKREQLESLQTLGFVER